MSNGWVVHGSRTASGRPMLANDPHLQIELPAVWWEVHVVSDTLDVTGVTIPGLPFVIIGHNARLGWGLTNAGTDVQDFFVEQLNPARTHYKVGEDWVPLNVRRHEIRVAGRSEPAIFELRSTRHGPVLNVARWREVFPGDSADYAALDETVLALKWDVIGQGTSASAFDGLARAANWPEFLAAVRQFSAPAQNFVYADVDGNIGYALSGLVPIRRESDGSVPVPGWPRDADWQGWVDPRQLPAMLNPPSGQIVTANNQIDMPFLVTRDWVAPFRAQRIIELLGDRTGLDVGEMQQIQRDITSRAADWILKDLELPAAAGDLRSWDRRVDERPVVALFEAFEEAMWRQTFGDEMDEPLYAQFYRYAGNERFAGLHAIIDDPHSRWFDDRKTEAVEARADIVARAFEDARSGLYARFGDTAVRWDSAHAVKFSHPLGGGGRVLDWFFSRGPFPIAGDSMTVNKTTVDLRQLYETSEAASYRQILDVGAWDRSMAVITTGQSGHPRSPHYFDQNALWRQGQYRAMPFSRAAVDAATVSRLELIP
jgi:penicillin amidase